MRKAGVGITDSDLRKIPVGVDIRFAKGDSDGDLLPDGLEVAIGTNPNKSDTDGDGYLDGAELRNGYNPNGSGNLKHDLNFAHKLKGKILLQVQKNGEAWYVNPTDGKRYYLGNGDLAFQIMRYLSLGISNQNLVSINVGQ
ncbi:thrombospondin type 3 repeat-containing protein [Patescibacteria group bacterium]|nr:thrombospondin type 3 repeat-containing protein [Patescibacteria group bacterium]